MSTRSWPILLLSLLAAAVAACASAPAAAPPRASSDLAEAYAAAVRHHAGASQPRGLALDPVVYVLYEQARLASDPPDTIPHPSSLISRLVASGMFTGVCEVRRSTHEPVCPDSARSRVLLSAARRVSADTLEFEAAFATLRRPGDIVRGYGVSCWYRVVRTGGAWTVADTRQLSVT